MNSQKCLTTVAILTLAFCMWTIGWVVNQVVTLPGWLHDFVLGAGVITSVGFICMAYRELMD